MVIAILLFSIGLIFMPALKIYTFLIIEAIIIPSFVLLKYYWNVIKPEKLYIVIILSSIIGIIWDYFAIKIGFWYFPEEGLFSFIGIPIQEFIFFIFYPMLIIGTYHIIRKNNFTVPWLHLKEKYCIYLVGIFQLTYLFITFITNRVTYLGLILFFAGAPSFYFLFRERERLHKYSLFFSIIILNAISIFIDYLAIKNNAWNYNNDFLIGKIGIIPIESIFFTTFITTVIIGLYETLPDKNVFFEKW